MILHILQLRELRRKVRGACHPQLTKNWEVAGKPALWDQTSSRVRPVPSAPYLTAFQPVALLTPSQEGLCPSGSTASIHHPLWFLFLFFPFYFTHRDQKSNYDYCFLLIISNSPTRI